MPIMTSESSARAGCKVLSVQEVMQHLETIISSMESTFYDVPRSTIRSLLTFMKWDQFKIVDKFFDDREKLFKDANVVDLEEKRPKKLRKDECDICCRSTIGDNIDVISGDCGHAFCSECWTAYVAERISTGLISAIPCPTPKCGILLRDDFIVSLISGDTKLLEKFQRGIANSFVECSRYHRWCPGMDCEYALSVADVSSERLTKVSCSKCRTVTCFSCGQTWHDPVPCSMLAKWLKKCVDDSETANWINANARNCPNPKCNSYIEKSGGCNFMRCGKCKYQFCWVCMKDWQKYHSDHFNCGQYKAESTGVADVAQLAREALARYIFFYNHYTGHLKSLKLESKLQQTVEEKVDLLHDQGLTYVVARSLHLAVDSLRRCRQTLTYTFVFAYYLRPSAQTSILEDNQSDLQKHVEQLSMYLERGVDDLTGQEYINKVRDEARYCDQRLQILVDHMHEGLDDGSWTFAD